MNEMAIGRTVVVACAVFAFAVPASAQVDLTGSYQTRMYEGYIERDLSEPHVVSRVWQWNPRGTEPERPQCNTANEIPSLEDTGSTGRRSRARTVQAAGRLRVARARLLLRLD